jgi:outer membrane protein assembly factor BamB
MKARRLLPILLIALAAVLVGACGKAPLVPDAPKGPATLLPGSTMACTTSTTDPSGAQVSYQFDWGNNSKSQWSQFMDGGVPYADTHSYANLGSYQIKVRAKNSKKASGWSEPLSINVVAEGRVVWSIGFANPEDIEDSADFSLNSFAIGPDNTAYVACEYGALIAGRPSGSAAWTFVLPDTSFDQITSAPVIADDGTILIGCSNEFVYALNSDGTVKWADSVGSQVGATGALGADGTSYFQTADSMVIALRPDGSKLWEFFTEGGNTAPVVGADGTVYAVNQNGIVYAIDPSAGGQKWASSVVGKPVTAPPAIDPTRNVLYVVDNETGLLQSLRLADGTGSSMQYTAGADASGPVVGPDGTVYIGGEGKLTAVNPDGDAKWVFTPTMTGTVSTPALTVDGYVYVLVVPGKKRLALQGTDSLYAVNPDGTRRWACGLGEGLSDPEYALSAPKLDPSGFIYVGDGIRAWCVAGVSAPAQSIWPMIHHDAQNTGRAR